MQNILVIPTSTLGDTIQFSGSIAHLRELYPEAHFFLALNDEKRDIFASFPKPYTIIRFNREPYNRHWFRLFNRTRKMYWHAILDLRCSILGIFLRCKKIYTLPRLKEGMHITELSTRIFGKQFETRIWPPSLESSMKDRLNKAKHWLVFAIASDQLSRSWPWQRFFNVAEQCLKEDPQLGIIMMAAKHTREQIGDRVMRSWAQSWSGRLIDAVGTFSLGEALALMNQSALVVSVDSGPLHLAAAIKKPIVALFGPTEENMTGPANFDQYAQVSFVRGAPSLTRRERDQMDHSQYSKEMLAISESMVIDSIRAMKKTLGIGAKHRV